MKLVNMKKRLGVMLATLFMGFLLAFQNAPVYAQTTPSIQSCAVIVNLEGIELTKESVPVPVIVRYEGFENILTPTRANIDLKEKNDEYPQLNPRAVTLNGKYWYTPEKYAHSVRVKLADEKDGLVKINGEYYQVTYADHDDIDESNYNVVFYTIQLKKIPSHFNIKVDIKDEKNQPVPFDGDLPLVVTKKNQVSNTSVTKKDGNYVYQVEISDVKDNLSNYKVELDPSLVKNNQFEYQGKKYTVTFKQENETNYVFEMKEGVVETPVKPEITHPSTSNNDHLFDDVYLPSVQVKPDHKEEVVTPSSYLSVSFVTDGGNHIETQYIKKGDKLVRPQDPSKQGYQFVGWMIDEDVLKQLQSYDPPRDEEHLVMFDFDTRITRNITLVAKWKKLPDQSIKQEESVPNTKDEFPLGVLVGMLLISGSVAFSIYQKHLYQR